MQLLEGEDPVLDWAKGTGLRPVLTALADDPEARDAFVDEYRDLLRKAYPAAPYGTVLPFRRLFVVARKGGKRSMSARGWGGAVPVCPARRGGAYCPV